MYRCCGARSTEPGPRGVGQRRYCTACCGHLAPWRPFYRAVHAHEVSRARGRAARLSRNGASVMARTVLITGSTDGIGLLAARRLAAMGHRILLHGRAPSTARPAVLRRHGPAAARQGQGGQGRRHRAGEKSSPSPMSSCAAKSPSIRPQIMDDLHGCPRRALRFDVPARRHRRHGCASPSGRHCPLAWSRSVGTRFKPAPA